MNQYSSALEAGVLEWVCDPISESMGFVPLLSNEQGRTSSGNLS